MTTDLGVDPFIPRSVTHALELWDDNQPIRTIEMGGMSPGYEQSIHIAVFEMLRSLKDRLLPDEKTDDSLKRLKTLMNETLEEVNKKHGLFLSHLQAASVQNLAWNYLKCGYEETLKSVEKRRWIMVKKHFPSSGDKNVA